MPQKRIYGNGVYFVTSRTSNSLKIFKNDRSCILFIETLKYCHEKLKFKLFAFVVIPDHVHLLILPNEQNTISDVVRHIKGRFANKYKSLIAEDKFLRCTDDDDNHNPAGEEFILAIGEPVWQRSFYDRVIRSDEQMFNTIQYINCNAVKHRLVDDPIKWPYSSFHNHCQTRKALIEIDYYEG